MKKLTTGAASAALAFTALATPVALIVPASPAIAMSPSEEWCLAQNSDTTTAVYSHDGGKAKCTITTTSNVGNSTNSQTVTMSDTDSSNGTLNNDPHYSSKSSCDGTGNTSTPQDHC